jgi:hypothetical protein
MQIHAVHFALLLTVCSRTHTSCQLAKHTSCQLVGGVHLADELLLVHSILCGSTMP